MDMNEELRQEKSILEYIFIASKVLKDKAWYTLWNFDLFEKVQRNFPQESYYNSLYTLITSDANKIIDNLYLGSAFNAADYNWLKQYNIKLIINVTPCISNYYENEIEYYNYNTLDLNSGSLLAFYDLFYDLIEKNQDKQILVHCFAGKSRSAALMLYYLMRKYQWQYDTALAYLKQRRPEINLNVVFVNEIQSLLPIVPTD